MIGGLGGYYAIYPRLAMEEDGLSPAQHLSMALVAGDRGMARAALDAGFWTDADFRPDARHLLYALESGDAALVKLVARAGARWTGEEAAAARMHFFSPQAWTDAAAALRRAGLPRKLWDAAYPSFDNAVLPAVRLLSLTAGDDGLLNADTRKQRDRLLHEGLLLDCRKDDRALTRALLPFAPRPLDTDALLAEAMKQRIPAPLVLRMVDGMLEDGYSLAPFTLLPGAPYYGLLGDLGARGLLPAGRMPQRIEVALLLLRADMHGVGVVEDIGRDYDALFRNGHPLTAEEVQAFKRMADGGNTAALEARGFFSTPAWTVAALRRLEEKAVEAGAFNAAARRADFTERFLRRPDFAGLSTFAATYGKTGYCADAAQAGHLLDFIHARTKDVHADWRVYRPAIHALRKGGSDFSAVDPVKYIGNLEPGLAWELLHAGIVAPAAFSGPKARRIVSDRMLRSFMQDISVLRRWVLFHDRLPSGPMEPRP